MCGKLIQKNKQIPFEIPRSKRICQESDNDKGKKERSVSGRSSLQGSNAPDVPAETTDSQVDNKLLPPKNTATRQGLTDRNLFDKQDGKEHQSINIQPLMSATICPLSVKSTNISQLKDDVVRNNDPECNANGLKTVDNVVVKNTQPAQTTVVNNKTAKGISVLSPLATNKTIKPAGNTLTKKQPVKHNTVSDQPSTNTKTIKSVVKTVTNNERAKNYSILTQPAAKRKTIQPAVKQPAESNSVVNQPATNSTKNIQSAGNAIMAYFHCRTRIQIWTRTRTQIPNTMATQYSQMSTVLILETDLLQGQIPIPITYISMRGSESESKPMGKSCIVQESVSQSERESKSGNGNKPQ